MEDNKLNYRIEHDSMGEVEVEKTCYWGAQTQRSKQNFKIGTQKMPLELIQAFLQLKKAAASSNMELKKLDERFALVIIKACDYFLGLEPKELAQHFPLVVWQTGSGTQTNMNVNEVVANKANELLGYTLDSKDKPIHPNDHVNYGQSSNDSFPSAMHIAIYEVITSKLLETLNYFANILNDKIIEFDGVFKIARTHLQDATPMKVSDEFGAFKRQIEANIERIKTTFPRLKQLAQGATAVGTGINCPNGFKELFVKNISKQLNLEFSNALNSFEALSSNDTALEVSSSLNTLAVSLMKIANDVRFLGSGPRCGLAELLLPENEPGSSIMPAKVNPTQAEALSMVCAQVMGNHVSVSIACSNGHFQLNVFKPVIIHNIMESINLLNDAILSFTDNCIKGIKLNLNKINEYTQNSLMLVTALNPVIGYEKAAQVAKLALKEDISLKQAAINLGFLTAQECDKYLRIT